MRPWLRRFVLLAVAAGVSGAQLARGDLARVRGCLARNAPELALAGAEEGTWP